MPDLSISNKTRPWANFDSHEIRYASEPVLIGNKHDSTFDRIAYRELLVRPSLDGILVRPDAFIERLELDPLRSLQFDMATFDYAMHRLRTSSEQRMGINISGSTISNSKFAEHVAGMIDRDPSKARQLVIEITETSPILDLDQAIRFTRAFQRMGGYVAVDDLGAKGRGEDRTLHMIRQLNPKILKIDHIRLKDLGKSEKRPSLLKSIIEMGHRLSARIVAEGVKDEATAMQLIRANVNMLQIHRAQPAPR